jgi:predicted RND superfamily exporter protein
MSKRIARLLLRRRWWLLAFAAAAAALCFWPARQLDFDRSIENMFAADEPLVASYEKLKRTFGGNEIVLAVYQDAGLLRPDGTGLRRSAAIGQRLARVPGVKGVLSIDMVMGDSIVDPDNEIARRYRELFRGYTHSEDGRTVALVCMLSAPDHAKISRRETIQRLRRVMRSLPGDLEPGLLAGEPVMVADVFRYVEQDGRRLGIASTLLLGVVIIVCFRSVRWVVIPLAVVQLTLLMTRAVLTWSGLRLTIVSSMLTAVVTVIGVATMVHVIVRYRDARAEGRLPPCAVLRMATLLVAPIFWACCTDAAGFAALMVAEVGPVRDYGLMMSIGSLLVMVSAGLLVPGLALLGRWDTDPHYAWGERLLDRQLSRSAFWTERYPRQLGVAAVLIVALISSGIPRLEVETDFTKNFRAGSPIVRSYQMIETQLGGAGVLDVILPAPERLDWQFLQQVGQLEEQLRRQVAVPIGADGEVSRLTKVISLADAVQAAIPAEVAQVTPAPLLDAMAASAIAVMRTRMPEFFRALHGEDPRQPGQHYLRIMMRAHERQPSEAKRELIQQVERISRSAFPEAEVTGLFVLLTRLIDSVLRDQWLTFGLAAIGVACMMTLAFRSIRLALVALIPNTAPILIVLGMMGWLGLRINLGAAMIAAVSMGLSVDSSIHYITSFRRARQQGESLSAAIHAVQHTVGRAMVYSTLALVVGFSVLCTSQFVPTIYFGVLVGLSMLGGLAGNLVVLPLLLSLVARNDPTR